jgi:hypothetical protein
MPAVRVIFYVFFLLPLLGLRMRSFCLSVCTGVFFIVTPYSNCFVFVAYLIVVKDSWMQIWRAAKTAVRATN